MTAPSPTSPTPTPWCVAGTGIGAANGRVVALVMDDHGDAGLRRADAEQIVRAVNAHSALVAACEAAEDWLLDADENPGERFERIADAFYRDTGILRPGKSEPLAMAGTHTDEEREERFRAWCRDHNRDVLAQLRAALALVRGET